MTVIQVMGRHEGRRYVGVYKHFAALKVEVYIMFCGEEILTLVSGLS